MAEQEAVIDFCNALEAAQQAPHDVSELCQECKDKLEKIIKDGFN